MKSQSKTLSRLKDVLWALAIAGLVVGAGRFAFGLGAATNMKDSLPWGWWKVFNMVAGAALATSGFVVAAIIYILKWKQYRPVARLSVVIGFLGYGSSLAALIFDIGLPHRGWHPFFMWNPHSFLFEVFWCVSIYWGVTALELLPLVTERFARLQHFTHMLHEKMLPFVVLGITLSTMHHSSLGSLFMMSPTRLHPLWYSTWIPPEFFLSAMGAGLSTIVIFLLVTAWLYEREPDLKVAGGLALGSAVMLSLFVLLRGVDFTVHDKWGLLFGPDVTWETRLFRVEIVLQALIPIAILSMPALRKKQWALLAGAGSAFVGVIMNRIDTGIVGYFRSAGDVYVPNISELILSFGVLSAAGLAYFFLIERFHIFEKPGAHVDEDEHHMVHPEVQPLTPDEAREIFGPKNLARAARFALIFIPLAVLGLRSQATHAFEPIHQPVSPTLRAEDPRRSIFAIDANRNGMSVRFDHLGHQQAFVKVYGVTQKETCTKCHHLSMPGDKNTACRRCHADMEIETAIFDLDRHRPRFETEAALDKFLQVDLGDRLATQKACMGCHRPGVEKSDPRRHAIAGLDKLGRKGFDFNAPGFMHAMHGSCLTCHRQREVERKMDIKSPKSSGNCTFCHRDWADKGLFAKEDAELYKKQAQREAQLAATEALALQAAKEQQAPQAQADDAPSKDQAAVDPAATGADAIQ